MKKSGILLILAIMLCCLIDTPAQALFKKRHKRSGEENCQLLIKSMKEKDPGVQKVFDNAFAWAVFPRISKAGIGIGGAGGNGRVYQKGKFIGTTTMSQISIGFQLGGQVYGEIIFFQDEFTLNKFKNGKFELGANISAVVFDVGAAETAGFKDGTLVFVIPDAGLMYEATISGQKFTFKAAR
ncbi:MAG: hypothetical protein CVV42_14440 [Candidatus Riflebacteria bacterium HGW-Riflebacteria-2]|jgi:lipid-binding SYLF domain-containing protein|nr:MAG: hypothetical protein CVV42_14440 [Candidatus Riflebacteria bacterium HGW-Riflebacteria-2]